MWNDRPSQSRRSRRHSRAACGALLAVGLAGLAAPIGAARAETNLTNNTTLITGPIVVRLAFTDANGTPQDDLLQSMPQAVKNVLPPSLQQLVQSPLLLAPGHGNGYFDQVWSSTRSSVCGDISGFISQQINDSTNQAYNVTCTPQPVGALQATIQPQWMDQYGFLVQGQRLLLNYWLPLNNSVFSVTTPTTCRQSNLVCAADPQMTAVFETDLTEAFENPNSTSLSVQPTYAHSGSIVLQSLVSGNYNAAIENAAVQFGISVGVSAGSSVVGGAPLSLAGILASVAKFLASLSGIGVSSVANAHLADQVSSKLSFAASPAAGSSSSAISQQFNALYQGLLAGQTVGFTQFGVAAGVDGSLIFRITYPQAAKPTLHNVIADTNSTPSLFQPSIGVDRSEVQPGNPLVVSGHYFHGSTAAQLLINWDRTVWGPTTTEIDWGPQGGAVQKATTTQGSFEVNNLTPGTNYQFRAHECDPITCAPWSDPLTAATGASGSDKVTLWLDNAAATPIGTATLDGNGNFTGNTTIPASTAPGQHTLHALVGQPLSFHFPIVLSTPAATSAAATTVTRLQPMLRTGTSVAGANGVPPNAATIAPVVITSGAAPALNTPALNTGAVNTAVLNTPVLNTPVANQPAPANPSAPAGSAGQQASTTVMVCGTTGCTPTIALINKDTNTVQSGTGQVENTMPFTLRGDSFGPGQPVAIFVDNPTGTPVGTTLADPNGTFQASFNMPSVQPGTNHQLVAVETANGRTLQATVGVFVQGLPQ